MKEETEKMWIGAGVLSFVLFVFPFLVLGYLKVMWNLMDWVYGK